MSSLVWHAAFDVNPIPPYPGTGCRLSLTRMAPWESDTRRLAFHGSYSDISATTSEPPRCGHRTRVARGRGTGWGRESWDEGSETHTSGTGLYIGEGGYAGIQYRVFVAQSPGWGNYLMSGWIEPTD